MIIFKAIFLISLFITAIAAISFALSVDHDTGPDIKYGYWYIGSLAVTTVSGILWVVLR